MAQSFCGKVSCPLDACCVVVVDGGGGRHHSVVKMKVSENLAEVSKVFYTFIGGIYLSFGRASSRDSLAFRLPMKGAVGPEDEAGE